MRYSLLFGTTFRRIVPTKLHDATRRMTVKPQPSTSEPAAICTVTIPAVQHTVRTVPAATECLYRTLFCLNYSCELQELRENQRTRQQNNVSSVIRRWASGAMRGQFQVTKERVPVLYVSIANYAIGVTEFH
jgi:hypothetical protein